MGKMKTTIYKGYTYECEDGHPKLRLLVAVMIFGISGVVVFKLLKWLAIATPSEAFAVGLSLAVVSTVIVCGVMGWILESV